MKNVALKREELTSQKNIGVYEIFGRLFLFTGPQSIEHA